jgi:hypothetical protein
MRPATPQDSGGGRLALSLPIDWIALLLGLFAAFVVEFLRYASPNFGPPKSPYKIVEIAARRFPPGKSTGQLY